MNIEITIIWENGRSCPSNYCRVLHLQLVHHLLFLLRSHSHFCFFVLPSFHFLADLTLRSEAVFIKVGCPIEFSEVPGALQLCLNVLHILVQIVNQNGPILLLLALTLLDVLTVSLQFSRDNILKRVVDVKCWVHLPIIIFHHWKGGFIVVREVSIINFTDCLIDWWCKIRYLMWPFRRSDRYLWRNCIIRLIFILEPTVYLNAHCSIRWSRYTPWSLLTLLIIPAYIYRASKTLRFLLCHFFYES